MYRQCLNVWYYFVWVNANSWRNCLVSRTFHFKFGGIHLLILSPHKSTKQIKLSNASSFLHLLFNSINLIDSYLELNLVLQASQWNDTLWGKLWWKQLIMMFSSLTYQWTHISHLEIKIHISFGWLRYKWQVYPVCLLNLLVYVQTFIYLFIHTFIQ
jgi:hypothetical protein